MLAFFPLPPCGQGNRIWQRRAFPPLPEGRGGDPSHQRWEGEGEQRQRCLLQETTRKLRAPLPPAPAARAPPSPRWGEGMSRLRSNAIALAGEGWGGGDRRRATALDQIAMPDGGGALTVRVIDRIAELPAAEWDACAGAGNPFLPHDFLEALEESGSATAENGWLPQHLALEDASGRLIGAAPLYLKGHSYGEYVFHHALAAPHERAGGAYYPKLPCAVPFTPVTGPRLLIRPDADPNSADALIAAMVELARRQKVSSLHVTFPTRGEWERFGAAGFLQRTGQQFHWENHGYAGFDDFLAALSSRKRKTIRREREAALAGGIEIHTLTGAAIEKRHWDAFFRFYISTSDRKWGSPYLTPPFFHLIADPLPPPIVLS